MLTWKQAASPCSDGRTSQEADLKGNRESMAQPHVFLRVGGVARLYIRRPKDKKSTCQTGSGVQWALSSGTRWIGVRALVKEDIKQPRQEISSSGEIHFKSRY